MQDELSRVLDALPGAIWTALPDGQVDFVNQSWADYTGLGVEESYGRGWQVAVHPDDLPELLEQWRSFLASHESGEMKVRLRRVDGGYRKFAFRVKPLLDGEGRVIKWYGINTDIEDQIPPEKALWSGEHDLKSVINTIPMMAWSTSANGYCDFCNQRWLDYAGLRLDQVQGWGWGAAIHPDDLDTLAKNWQSCLATGTPGNFEARMRRFDGVYRWFQFLGNPLRDESGNIVKWFGQNIDIENRKRAEDELKTTERGLVRIINAIPELAWSTGSDGSVDFLNQRWLDYTGFTSDQALGWNWVKALHPDDKDGLAEYWKSIMRSETPGEYEARLRRFDGIYRWFLFRAVPVKDESGAVIKWYGQNIDIEVRKRAEDTVRAQEQALRETINTIPTPAFSTLADGYVDFLNQRWLDYAGMTAEQAQGWGWGAAVHPDDADRLLQRWRSCLASGTEAEVEARYRRFDGIYRWCLVRAKPLRDESGNVVKWYGISIDIEDRKRAEEELKAKERDLIRIINTIPTTAWSTRPDGYCEFLSDRWLDYAGFTYDQAVGWGWSAAIHPDDTAGLQDVWVKALATGTPVNTEARMRRFDGVYRWFLFLAKPLRDESGTIVKWYGTNVDIEDRKQADQALRARERNLNLIINTIPMLAWSTDPTGFVEFLNRRWLEFTGLSAEQASGFGWSAAIHPEDAKGLLDYWQAALASGTDVDVEARMRRFDGQFRWFLFRASPLRDESGNIVKWYGTNVDIEDRKRADEELRRSEAFLAEGQRLNLTGSFSWRLDTDEIIISEQLYRIYELDHDAPVTLDLIAGRVHPDDLPFVSDKITRARSGHSDLSYEFRLRMPDDTVKYLRTVAHSVRDQAGRREIMGAVQDVTERQLSEQALGKVRSELAHVTRVTSLGVLTASITHEISQPLSGIINNASTCQRMLSADPPNVEGALETARRTIRDGNRASEVVTRLRALFTKKDVAFETVDLSEATREVIALSFNDFQRNRVILRSELSDDLPSVMGDRIQLQQVILNLVRNAVEAMGGIDDRPRQLVVITERDGDDSVRMAVRDSGVGIDPKNVDRLFEAFYTTKSAGMGMGLSVSRSIIESHQGRLWVAPNDGPGATFFFSIPRVTEGALGAKTLKTTLPFGLTDTQAAPRNP